MLPFLWLHIVVFSPQLIDWLHWKTALSFQMKKSTSAIAVSVKQIRKAFTNNKQRVISRSIFLKVTLFSLFPFYSSRNNLDNWWRSILTIYKRYRLTSFILPSSIRRTTGRTKDRLKFSVLWYGPSTPSVQTRTPSRLRISKIRAFICSKAFSPQSE